MIKQLNKNQTRCGLLLKTKLVNTGFSLIEIMVSMTMGLVIMAGLTSFYLNVTNHNRSMEASSWQIENARFALQLLQQDIAHAGFWDSHIPKFDDLSYTAVPDDVPTDFANPCTAYTSWDATYIKNLIGVSLWGGEVPTAWSTSCGNLFTNKVTNTDILIVHHADTCLAANTDCGIYDPTKLYFQTSRSYGGYCVSPNTPDSTPYVLGVDTALDTLHARNCTTPITTKRKFISNVYWIRNYEATAGDGIPTLVRSEFDKYGSALIQKPAEALIGGVEGFRVELGIDNVSDAGTAVNFAATITWADSTTKVSPTNRGDGVSDGAFIHCTTSGTTCNAATLMNVVAAKIYLLMRDRQTIAGYQDTKTYTLGSTTPLGPYNDGFRRHLYSTTVRLINVAGRRETPP